MAAGRGGRRRRAGGDCARSRCAGSTSWSQTSAGTLLAYRSECPAAARDLGDATLEGEILTCGDCKHGYVLTEAGRAVGSDDVHLEPVPLLRRDGGGVAVAVAT